MEVLIRFDMQSVQAAKRLDLAMNYVAEVEHAGFYSSPGELIRGHGFGWSADFIEDEYHQYRLWNQWKTCAGNILRWRANGEHMLVWAGGRRHGIPWWVLGRGYNLYFPDERIADTWAALVGKATITYESTQTPDLVPWHTESRQEPNFCIDSYIEKRAAVYAEMNAASINYDF